MHSSLLRLKKWLIFGAVVGIVVAISVVSFLYFTKDSGTETGTSQLLDPTPQPTVDSGPVWLQDVTKGSGLDFTYRNSEEADLFTILESLGGGVALIDYDGDGGSISS